MESQRDVLIQTVDVLAKSLAMLILHDLKTNRVVPKVFADGVSQHMKLVENHVENQILIK